MKPQDFYTKTPASRGVRVELVDPAGNREWVIVRSVLSSEFAAAITASWAQVIAEGPLPSDDRAARKRRNRRVRAALSASLIAEWSLPAEIVPAELLVINPRLRRQIERIAEDPAVHFGASHG